MGLSVHPIGGWRDATFLFEEFSEGGLVAVVELSCYFADGQLGEAEKMAGFVVEQTCEVVTHSVVQLLSHNAREIDGRDVELGGIEGDVVLLAIVLKHEVEEAVDGFFGVRSFPCLWQLFRQMSEQVVHDGVSQML